MARTTTTVVLRAAIENTVKIQVGEENSLWSWFKHSSCNTSACCGEYLVGRISIDLFKWVHIWENSIRYQKAPQILEQPGTWERGNHVNTCPDECGKGRQRKKKPTKTPQKCLSRHLHKTLTYTSAFEILESKTSWGFSGNFWYSSRINL